MVDAVARKRGGNGRKQASDIHRAMLPLSYGNGQADREAVSEKPLPPNGSDDEAYVISAGEDVEIPAKWLSMATYDLELPARCPQCREPIRTLKVVRLMRSKVAFMSTLPRGGRAVVCPQCECIVSVEISGLI
jgi:hypothetical protein